MNSGILDSSVLIDCLRGRAGAVGFLANHPSPTTHVMVAAELFAGARDKAEQQQVESFLASFVIVSPSESDGLAALEHYKRFHLSHGVD
jgi:predicted nucleic acid-binding protein